MTTLSTGDLAIRAVPFDAPESRTLLAAALADLATRYGGSGDDTPVDPAEFRPPNGVFLVATIDGTGVGCAGWRRHGADAELKRLFTVAEVRGRGIARRLLAAVEESARAAGLRRLILECGDRQPEAVALYHSSGYERIPNFGYYRDHPACLSFGRPL